MTNEQIKNQILRVLTNHNQASLFGLNQIINVNIDLLKNTIEELILSEDIYLTKTTWMDQGYFVYKLNRKKKR